MKRHGDRGFGLLVRDVVASHHLGWAVAGACLLVAVISAILLLRSDVAAYRRAS